MYIAFKTISALLLPSIKVNTWFISISRIHVYYLLFIFFTLQYWSLRETFWMDEKKTCHVYISAWCTALLYCAYEKLIITFWNNLALKCKNIKWSTFITWKKNNDFMQPNFLYLLILHFVQTKCNICNYVGLVLLQTSNSNQ